MITQRDGTITHVGLVVGPRYETTQCQGEVYTSYVDIFNPSTNTVESFEIGFYCQGKWESDLLYTVDLLPQYRDILIAQRAARLAELDARTMNKGKTVKILKGKNKGLIGVIFWMGKDKFNAGNSLGIKTNTGTVFANEYYCEIYTSKLENALK